MENNLVENSRIVEMEEVEDRLEYQVCLDLDISEYFSTILQECCCMGHRNQCSLDDPCLISYDVHNHHHVHGHRVHNHLHGDHHGHNHPHGGHHVHNLHDGHHDVLCTHNVSQEPFSLQSLVS